MRVLILTTVHHPLDARIFERQAKALLDAGHHVTLAAGWAKVEDRPEAPGLELVELPTATGLRRAKADLEARRLLREQGPEFDLVLLHDPELIAAAWGVSTAPIVFDVHEDTGSALIDKPWLPQFAKASAGRLVRRLEVHAEQEMHLLLAEPSYAERFAEPHPVVPNEPVVPEEYVPYRRPTVVYLGRISASRGLDDLVQVASLLPPGIDLELIGWAEPEVLGKVKAAHELGILTWVGEGRVANDEALARLDGALAGLSLIHELPNFQQSRPTKVVEYMSRGLPVISTPNPIARDIIETHECGMVVPFGDPVAVVAAVCAYNDDPGLRNAHGAAAHRAAFRDYNWSNTGPSFVELLENWASGKSPRRDWERV